MIALIPSRYLSLLLGLAAASSLALLPGCDSPAKRRAMREQMTPPQQPLQGSESFFGGKVSVVARLTSPMEFMGPQRPGEEGPDGSKGEKGKGGGGPGGGGGFSMGMGGGGGGMGMGGGGGMGMGGGGGMGMGGGPGGGMGGGPGGGMGGGPGDDMGGGPGGGGMRGGPGGGPGGMGGMPRQFLKITFTNKTNEAVPVLVADVQSKLGNLAPVPDKFKLDPAQSLALGAMRGSLDINFDSFEVTLRVRSGNIEETKTIHLSPTGEVLRRPPPPGAGGGNPPPPPPGS